MWFVPFQVKDDSIDRLPEHLLLLTFEGGKNMCRMRSLPIICFLLLVVSSVTTLTVYAEKITRKNIDVVYQHRQIADGFGNIRKVTIQGYVKNRDSRTASKIILRYKFLWTNRRSISKKLSFLNVPPGGIKNFEFDIDVGTRPDSLQSITCKIERIKFSRKREVSSLTDHHLVLHDFHSLARLNEEGKDFLSILRLLKKKMLFTVPLQEEFETTDEYESRVNEAENDHFARMMDELEKQYGQLLGGRNAIVRFLPRSYNNALVYLSECSSYTNVSLVLGRYNADKQQFENISLSPRTFPFAPEVRVPDTDVHLMHKTGMFFLRNSEIKLSRNEAREWRRQDKFLAIEIVLRNGVMQDGPYFTDFCVAEKVQVKNIKTGKVIREWSINP